MKYCKEKETWQCNVCGLEFTIIAEPNHTGQLPVDGSVDHCPFCGSDRTAGEIERMDGE